MCSLPSSACDSRMRNGACSNTLRAAGSQRPRPHGLLQHQPPGVQTPCMFYCNPITPGRAHCTLMVHNLGCLRRSVGSCETWRADHERRGSLFTTSVWVRCLRDALPSHMGNRQRKRDRDPWPLHLLALDVRIGAWTQALLWPALTVATAKTAASLQAGVSLTLKKRLWLPYRYSLPI